VVAAGVLREYLRFPGVEAPRNPTTGEATTSAHNTALVLRYRVNAAPPLPVRAVLVAMPGFLGGAASFDPLARALVARSAASGTAVEVWALDRRSNLLEDLRGMDAADALEDPELASGYYFGESVTFGGQAFGGFRDPTDRALSPLSEWGLATTLGDLRAVLQRVPDARDHVVLLGHSLGATLIEAYAAWDFNGTPGYRSIAGMVLLDGVLSSAAVTEAQYLTTGSPGFAGFGFPALATMRAQGPYFIALPVLGVAVQALAEIGARRALAAPEGVVQDSARDRLLSLLLGAQGASLTNAAAFGLTFDDASCPLAFARMGLGAPRGGALTTRPNPFAPMETITVPASRTDRYGWTDAPEVSPREFTSIANGARSWAATPTNFGEWYFPTRIVMDVSALGNLRNGEGSWPWREGLRASHGGEVDVPVLGISAALVGRAQAFDVVRGRLSPTVGEGLPRAGLARSDPAAFRAMHVPAMTHLDITTADDAPGNPVPEAVLTFAVGNTRGAVTLMP
jgi:hypothetical protein